MNETICIICKNYLDDAGIDYCKILPEYNKDYITNKTKIEYKLCILKNDKGKCKDFEMKYEKISFRLFIDLLKRISL